MDNPEECSVCFTTFDESEHRPRTLPCGHTFCSPCLGDMIEGGTLACPGCRATHPATSVTQFHINFSIEALVKKLRALKSPQTLTVQEVTGKTPAAAGESGATVAAAGATSLKLSTGISRKLRSTLEKQKSSVSSLATGCQEEQCQLDQYLVQLKDWRTQHLDLLDRLYDLVGQHKEALELLQAEDTRVLALKKEGEEGVRQLQVVLGCLQAVTTPQEIFAAINHADCNMEVVDDWKQKCHELFPDIKTFTTSRKMRENTQVALETLGVEYGATPDNATQDGSTELLDRQNLTIMEMVEELETSPELLRGPSLGGTSLG